MLRLSEYIAKRISEDNLDERDRNQAKRLNNTRVCVNYVFEYFNNYLEISPEEEMTAIQNDRVEKYRKQLTKAYSRQTVAWLVQIYQRYGNRFDYIVAANIFYEDNLFLLYTEESEFRSMSYKLISRHVGKYPFLKNEQEMITSFLIDHHKYLGTLRDFPFITEDINNWMENTFSVYGVNIIMFCQKWLHYFDKTLVSMKPPVVWVDDDEYINYSYKTNTNLFDIDSFYTIACNKEFVRGRKQEFECVMMYLWLHGRVIDEEYWKTYLKMALKVIEKRHLD